MPRGAPITIVATGIRPLPASSAEYPRTNCRYCVRKKMVPNKAKNSSVTETQPAAKRRSEK